MALLETMSYGIVPLVTDVGSIGDYVVDGKNGKIVKAGDSKSLYNAIVYLFENRKAINSFSTEAYETINSNFSKNEYIEKLIEIYDKVRL